jgi:hypothetical protein
VGETAADESGRCGLGGERNSKAPPFSNGGKRMGHPRLLIARPDGGDKLLDRVGATSVAIRALIQRTEH